jgi:hypothetical protein
VSGLGATAALTGTTWTQQAELTSTAQAPNDGYGSPVAVSGNTAAVGAADTPPWPSPAYGAAYIFTRTASGAWSQQAELLDPQHGSGRDDFFGDALALQGNTLVVGAFGATGVTTDTGAAYVYFRSGGTWTLQATVTASDGAYIDGFGSAVALSGTTLVVGAPGKNNGEGAAYVFVYSGGAWRQQAEVAYPGHILYAAFGQAVAVWGNTAVVGAPLAPVAFLYARSGTTWGLQAVLSAPHPGYLLFGRSVAVWGGTVLVGAPNAIAAQPGAVYVFGSSGGTWALQATLTPPTTVSDSGFGFSVGLNRSTAVVGGDGAFIFVGSGQSWTRTQLIPTDRAADTIGIAVAVSGNTALVGAGGTPPAGYVFVRSGTDGAAVDGMDMSHPLAHRYKPGRGERRGG